MPADNDPGPTARVDRKNIQLPVPKPFSDSATNGEAAIGWRKFGFHVIPIIPGTKQTAVKWNPWLADLSLESIARYWALYPEREVGMIVGDGLFVLDADTPESLTTILRFEEEFGVRALLTNVTPKGQHRFYRRATGTHGKPDAHDSRTHPDRPDVRTGRSLIKLPPGTGRSIQFCAASSADDFDEIGQDFIDAVARHNGREFPRQREPGNFPVIAFAPSSDVLRELEALSGCLDPDMGYGDWLQVLMALFHTTAGDDEGLALADAWSSQGSKYRGSKDLETKWRSFGADEPNPVTIATLRHMVDKAGYDWIEICAATGPQFEVCEYEILPASAANQVLETVVTTLLDRYSLKGRSAELKRLAIESVPVLGKLALKGQATAIYASPNTGKTLIVLHLLIEAIQAGRINPARLYYLNMDDTHRGILEKTELAEEMGFHVLAEGHRGFSASKFATDVETMIEKGQARDVILVLDTLKKFTNLMDKVRASQFTRLARQLVMQGATVIALAHTNKNPGSDGKPRYGGTSDIVDDFDCAYTVAVVTPRDADGYKVIEFENFKRRGFVAETAAYRYDPTPRDSYLDLLLSVEEIDPTQVVTLRQVEQIRTDAEMVDVIKACIRDGIDTRMRLTKAVMQRAGASRRRVFEILDRYTGEDPGKHHWRFSTGARGSWVYELLDGPPSDDEVLVVDS